MSLRTTDCSVLDAPGVRLQCPRSLFFAGAQGDHVDPAKRLYANILDCVRKTSKEGLGAFYKGFTPSITRAIPVNGAIFTGFTAAQRALN